MRVPLRLSVIDRVVRVSDIISRAIDKSPYVRVVNASIELALG